MPACVVLIEFIKYSEKIRRVLFLSGEGNFMCISVKFQWKLYFFH